jgi:hypothetical protein
LNNLGIALAAEGRFDEAIEELSQGHPDQSEFLPKR